MEKYCKNCETYFETNNNHLTQDTCNVCGDELYNSKCDACDYAMDCRDQCITEEN